MCVLLSNKPGCGQAQAEHWALSGSQHVTGCNLRGTRNLVVPEPAAWQHASASNREEEHLWVEQGVGRSTAEADRQQLLRICEGLAPHQHTVKVSLILQTSQDMPRTSGQLQESRCPLNCYQRQAPAHWPASEAPHDLAQLTPRVVQANCSLLKPAGCHAAATRAGMQGLVLQPHDPAPASCWAAAIL